MTFPPTPHCEESALFVIVMNTPDGDLTVPAGSARAAAQAARHLNECNPHVKEAWGVNPNPRLRRPPLTGHSRKEGNST